MTTTQCRLTILSLVAALALVLGFVLVPMMGSAQSATPAVASPAADTLLAQGEQTYNNLCIACHRPGGMGVKGIFPTLAGDPFVKVDDPSVVIATVLNGRGGMPRFGGSFNDEQIAAIVTYIRASWGNDASAVTPEQVAAIRAYYSATPVAGTPVVNTEQSPHGETTQPPANAATPTP